ncbi:MAG: glycosyltransferase family 2 protein [Euryarchaeota archaeon]|nr:glycosyltransferase family 2 protein [Euryarchaeota archaeon]
MSVYLLVPARDAAATLPGVLARLPPGDWRLVVVDDGSRDTTALEARRAAEKRSLPLTLLTHPRPRGYGAAQKSGFRRALQEGAFLVALLHSDGQYPPERLPDLLAPLHDGRAQVAIGYLPLSEARAHGMPLHKRWGSRLLTALQNRATGARLHGYHSGFRAYTRRALESIPYEEFSDYYEFDTEMLLAAIRRGLPIHEFPVQVAYFPGSSHLNPIRYGLRILRCLHRYRQGAYNPPAQPSVDTPKKH